MTDKKIEPIVEYYDDGKISRAYCVDENGELEGPYESYWPNGQLCVKCTYKDGKEDGPCKSYHDDGQLWEKCTYKDGKLDGPYVLYHKNGQLKKKCIYKDGEYDGPYEEYRDNGRLWEKLVYRMGERLDGKEAEEYLKEWNEKRITAQEARKGLNARLAQMDKQMAPTQLRQSIKRAEVAKFRAKFPNKKDGR